MENIYIIPQSKELAAIYEDAHRMRQAAIQNAIRSLVASVRGLFAAGGARAAH